MAPRIVYTAPANPLMQVVYLIVGTILLIGAIVMGAVVLSVVFGFALVIGLVVWARIWWLRRKFAKAARRQHGAGQRRTEDGVEITEVEYHVVRESRRDDED